MTMHVSVNVTEISNDNACHAYKWSDTNPARRETEDLIQVFVDGSDNEPDIFANYDSGGGLTLIICQILTINFTENGFNVTWFLSLFLVFNYPNKYIF